MSDRLTIALAQLNPTMGAIEANAELIREARATAASQGPDLVVGTELCITGYPPEDLVLKPSFLAASRAAVRVDPGQSHQNRSVFALKLRFPAPNGFNRSYFAGGLPRKPPCLPRF